MGSLKLFGHASVALFCFCAGQQIMPRHIKGSESKLAIKVTVDGNQVDFPGATPMLVGSTILVPLRGVFEKLGAQVGWDATNQTVTADRNGTEVQLQVGKSDASVGGKPVSLDQPPVVSEGRVMVPLRFLSQSLGAKVDWLKNDRTVAITTHPEASEHP